MTRRQRTLRGVAAVAATFVATSAVAICIGTTASEARVGSGQRVGVPLPGWEQDWNRIMGSSSLLGRRLQVHKSELRFSTSDLTVFAKPRKMNSGQIAEIEAARRAGGAAGQARQNKDGKPPVLWRGQRLVETSEPILFATGSAELSPHLVKVIQDAVKGLPDSTSLAFYGFSDFRGDEFDNRTLARERAENVEKVVKAARPKVFGWVHFAQTELGDNFSADANVSREERAKFLRRVDIRINPKG